jgi:hypothetical protein
MAKVRVPKELRPPSRFGAFPDPEYNPEVYGEIFCGLFRCTGKFRQSKRGEYYWNGEQVS